MKTIFTTLVLLLGQALLGANAAAQTASAPATAIFAGGSFWAVEADFEKVAGVFKAESGYINGQASAPSHDQVNTGTTGHALAVRVSYDSAKISYPQLLDHFWRSIDPSAKDRQFCDTGTQYRTGIYYLNEAQRDAAQKSKALLLKSGRFQEVHTEVVAAGTFYTAEEKHQDYYKKDPLNYQYYRTTCGRDARLKRLWD